MNNSFLFPFLTILPTEKEFAKKLLHFILELGPCAGWRNKCDDKDVDTCDNGDCYCGENKGPACTGSSNTCTGGVCKCGTKDACTAKNVDTCSTNNEIGYDYCTCAGATECSGQSDTCTEG